MKYSNYRIIEKNEKFYTQKKYKILNKHFWLYQCDLKDLELWADVTTTLCYIFLPIIICVHIFMNFYDPNTSFNFLFIIEFILLLILLAVYLSNRKFTLSLNTAKLDIEKQIEKKEKIKKQKIKKIHYLDLKTERLDKLSNL